MLSATIQSLAVPAIATEGATVDVSAEVKGSDAVQFDWTVSQGSEVIVTGSTQDFSFVPPDDGVYRVDLIVTDPETEQTDTGSALLLVDNQPPTIEGLAATPISEHQSTLLTGTISDPGDDTFRLEIDWGDPLSPGDSQTIDFNTPQPGVTYNPATGEFSIEHQYLDDNPVGISGAMYDIRVTVFDEDGGESFTETTVSVANVAPRLEGIVADEIGEGGLTVLSGAIVDPGSRDTFTLTVNWGDGQVEEYLFGAGTTAFEIEHQYADDQPEDLPDEFRIRLTLLDDDLDMVVDAVDVGVENLAPTIDEVADASIDEGQQLLLGIPIEPTTQAPTGEVLAVTFTDPGSSDTHTATVDWGDGSAVESLLVIQGSGEGALSGAHAYADNGLYTVTLTVTDDDGGSDVETFQVNVANVAPTLTGAEEQSVTEGSAVTLTGLGIGLSDPGYDNSNNSSELENGGQTQETFVGATIDWGDGSAATPIDAITDRLSGGPGTPTTASFEHADHYYADDGVYTVTVTFRDDDGGEASESFLITVENAAPTLTLTDELFVLLEGDTLVLNGLGTFSDPGFDNSLNPNGPSQESFDYLIDWGDGSTEVLKLPVTTVSGAPLDPTTGTLTSTSEPIEHRYLDNDLDNAYTVTVTLRDDDGGFDQQSFEITVLNVNPTLDPIAATDLTSDPTTTLSLTFSDPGADEFEVLVDWGDQLGLAPEDRFVVADVYAGATPETFTIDYTYNGPPDPSNPTAGITISVKIRDDDYGTSAVSVAPGGVQTLVVTPFTAEVALVEVTAPFVPGESNVQSTTIEAPGIVANPGVVDPSADEDRVAIDTTPQIEPLRIPAPEPFATAATQATVVEQVVNEIRSVVGELSATSDSFLELRVLRPDGTLQETLRLPVDSLDDLPSLFERLSVNRYQLWFVRGENNTYRLVIDVYVQDGKPVDLSDDLEGGRDQPPTTQPEALQGDPAPQQPEANDQGWLEPTTGAQEKGIAEAATGAAPWVAIAGGLVVTGALRRPGSKRSQWADQLDAALETATEEQWRRLRWRNLPR